MGKLPYNDFSWMDRAEFEEIDWKEVDTEGEFGYILEVDLTYPEKLHKTHSNFPVAPENVEIRFENLSPLSQDFCFSLENNDKYKDVKLVSTFHKRREYVTHFKNLKLYLELGLELKKVRRVLKFRQNNFILPFIERCTFFRQMSKTKFERDQFKKVANSVYGKTIQNARNYIQVRLHSTLASLQRALNSHSFTNFSIIGDKLVQTNHRLTEIKHDKPISVGFTILELSKHFMFDFYYNKLAKGLNCEIDLGMSDTDSLLFKVGNAEVFRKHIHPYMDYSNYPPEHPLFSDVNNSKLGFFKDELAGVNKCSEFVGLRSKCYAMKFHDINIEKKFAKDLEEWRSRTGLNSTITKSA